MISLTLMEVESLAPRSSLCRPAPLSSTTGRSSPPGARPALHRGRADARSRRRRSGAADGFPTMSSPTSSARRIAAGLAGGLHAREHGGQGWTRLEWVLVEEQYGRTTNAIHWHVPNAYNVWAHAQPGAGRALPAPGAARASCKDAYAVTERDAGSDPSAIAATAEPTNGGYRLNAEKWFVTAGDIASVFIVMANVIDGYDRLPTLFVVDRVAARGRDRRRPRLHPQLSRGPPHHPLHQRRGLRGRRDRRRGRRRRAAALVVHRGAPRDRRSLRRRDVAPARRDRRLGHGARAGRRPGLRLPGRLASRSPTRRPTPPRAGC